MQSNILGTEIRSKEDYVYFRLSDRGFQNLGMFANLPRREGWDILARSSSILLSNSRDTSVIMFQSNSQIAVGESYDRIRFHCVGSIFFRRTMISVQGESFEIDASWRTSLSPGEIQRIFNVASSDLKATIHTTMHTPHRAKQSATINPSDHCNAYFYTS